MLVGGTGRALREGDQEPGFGCHRAVKVSQGLKSPWGQEMRDFSPLWHVLMPGIFQLLVLKVRAILNDFRADSVTRRVWRHHSPGSVLLVCLFLGSAWVFYWLPAAGGPSACSCGTDDVPRLLLLPGSAPWGAAHIARAPACCSSTELSPGGLWNRFSRRSHFAALFIGYSGFYSTTASVTVTPEWLRSGSE